MAWRQLSHDEKQYTYEYFLQENVCRICWQFNASMELSKYENEVKTSLKHKIKECLDIELNPKIIINKICDSCCKEVENFYDFKKFCKGNEIILNEIFEKNSYSAENYKVDQDTNSDTTETLYQMHLDEFAESLPRKVQKKKFKSKHGNACFDCNICHINFKDKNELNVHNRDLHGIENNGTLFKCFGCEKRFNSRQRRVTHEGRFCKALKDGYRCNICGRVLPRRRYYEIHMVKHRNNVNIDLPEYVVKCKKCKEIFKCKKSLQEHLLVHSNVKHFVCDNCGKVFTRLDYLQKHKLIHTGEKKHKCPHCDFRATQKSSLTVHIRKHTGERPYSCDLCPQQCTSSSNLLAHKRRHLGVKKFECNICKKKFGYKLSLDEHISSTHESQSHSCDICGASYTRNSGLRRHRLTKHGKGGKNGNLDYIKDGNVNYIKDGNVDNYIKDTNVDYIKDRNVENYIEGGNVDNYIKNGNVDYIKDDNVDFIKDDNVDYIKDGNVDNHDVFKNIDQSKISMDSVNIGNCSNINHAKDGLDNFNNRQGKINNIDDGNVDSGVVKANCDTETKTDVNLIEFKEVLIVKNTNVVFLI